jgi:hypothetical protein
MTRLISKELIRENNTSAVVVVVVIVEAEFVFLLVRFEFLVNIIITPALLAFLGKRMRLTLFYFSFSEMSYF